jgi:hypothetical protein
MCNRELPKGLLRRLPANLPQESVLKWFLLFRPVLQVIHPSLTKMVFTPFLRPPNYTALRLLKYDFEFYV